MNTKMLMSSAQYFSNAQAINPYYHHEMVDVAGVVCEHREIARLFQEAGIEVVYAEPPYNSQDGVYTANWGLVRNGKAVLSRLPDARKAEEPVARQALERLGYEVLEVPSDWRWSGQGDALPFGDLLFCGQGYRSDAEAQEFVAQILGYECVQLQTIPEMNEAGEPSTNTVTGWPDSFFYDIDLALAIIREPRDGVHGIIAYCPEAFTTESRTKLEALTSVDKIVVSLDEAQNGFACNLVSTGEVVIMSDRAPHLKAELAKHGLTVVSPHVTELVKGGGFIRCVSLTLGE